MLFICYCLLFFDIAALGQCMQWLADDHLQDLLEDRQFAARECLGGLRSAWQWAFEEVPIETGIERHFHEQASIDQFLSSEQDLIDQEAQASPGACGVAVGTFSDDPDVAELYRIWNLN